MMIFSSLLLPLVLFIWILSAYYWLIHPLVVLVLQKFEKTKKLESPNLSSNMNGSCFKKILIVPTFGSRSVIIDKLNLLEKLCTSKPLKEVDHIYFIYSEPAPTVLKELEQKLSNSQLREKLSLIIEDKRLGKAHAINHVLTLAYNNYGRTILAIVNDDDAFFTENDLANLLSCFTLHSKVAVGCIYPVYQGGVLNLFYKYKRFIHSLESRLCNPVIGGELMAFRTDIIDHLEEDSISEDLYASILAMVKGYKVKIMSGNVTEKYPKTISGIRYRTRRVVLGTIIEYLRFFKLLEPKCKYIYGAYTSSLLFLPMLFLSSVFLLVLIILPFMNMLPNTIPMFLSLISIFLLYFLRNVITFIFGTFLGVLDVLMMISKSKIVSKPLNIKEAWRESKYN